jgi:RimJ/RimL family protein N-acetyltransferase
MAAASGRDEPVRELETDRLLLRRWRPADRELFAALNADPEVMRHFSGTMTREASDAFVDRIEALFEEQGFGLWALEVKDGDAFIGFTGLHPMPLGVPGAGGFEVGWRLARGAWGHGYATEAARAAVAFAFDEVQLPELFSMTAVSNLRSQAVMQRLGMTLLAHVEHPQVPVGHPVRPHVVHHLARP